MRKRKLLSILVCLVFVVGVIGCSGQPKSTSSKDAINQAQALQTVEEKVKYLVSEANAYLNSEKFDEAISLAKHIISNLDQNSVEAKSILEKAQAELKALAEKKAEEMKSKLKGFGQ